MERERRPISNRVAITTAGILLAVAGGLTAVKCSENKPQATPKPSATLSTPRPSEAGSSPMPDVSFPIETNNPTETREPEKVGRIIKLSEEVNLSLSNQGLQWTPDGHIPYISLSNGQKRFFTVGLASSYIIATSGESLQDAIQAGVLENPKNVREVLGKTQNPEYNYSGITSVFQLDSLNENHLTAILHQEEWPSAQNGAGFTASIGVFESFDAGLTWQNGRTIIQGDDYKEPGGERVSGAGQPNAIKIGDYLYIYYIDWSANGRHPDQIYLSRTKIENGTINKNVEYYTNEGFSTDNSNMEPVIPVAVNIPNAGYSALPSISFNNYLNKYLAVIETNVGFAQTTSEDGIIWSEPKLFFEFPQSQAERQINEIWYSYPTLVSDSQESTDNKTDKTGRLYFSKGNWQANAHNLVSASFEIK